MQNINGHPNNHANTGTATKQAHIYKNAGFKRIGPGLLKFTIAGQGSLVVNGLKAAPEN